MTGNRKGRFGIGRGGTGFRLGCAALSGVLFALSLPPHNAEWLGWIALAPLLVVLAPSHGAPPLRGLHAIGYGMLTGLVCGVVQVGWHPNVTALDFAYLPYIWIALVFGVVAGIVSAGRRLWPDGWGLVGTLFVACAGVGVEWLTTFSPLPVGVALCQHRNLPLLQVASLTGIWGISFLLWWINAAIADAALQRRVTGSLKLALAALAFVLVLGVVVLRIAPSGPTVIVAATQDYDGIDAGAVVTRSADSAAPVEKEDLIRQAAARGARLIVGTEEAWGSAFHPDDPNTDAGRLSRETNALLVVGFEQRGEPKPFNSAALVGPDGATLGIHHKIKAFLGERQNIQTGTEAHAWPTPLGRVGLLICFDSCYTGATRQAVGDGARIVAMPNYDPPTPRAVLHELHAALIPFRAAENGVAFVRADPNGLSQIIDPNGRIVAESPMYRALPLVAPVALGNGQGTFFTRWGDWLPFVCVAFVIGTLAAILGRKRRAEK